MVAVVLPDAEQVAAGDGDRRHELHGVERELAEIGLPEDGSRALLRDGLRDGTLGPGAKLPAERVLVERLSAPRSAIRRALEALEREGLVVREVGRGTFLTEVAAPPRGRRPDQHQPRRDHAGPPADRTTVTALAARVAAQADLDRINHCLDQGNQSYQDRPQCSGLQAGGEADLPA